MAGGKRPKGRVAETGRRILGSFRRVVAGVRPSAFKARGKFTLMLIPHGVEKPYSVRIGLAGILLFLGTIVVLSGASIYMIHDGFARMEQMERSTEGLSETRASVDALRDDVLELLGGARSFERILDDTLVSLPGNSSSDSARRLDDLLAGEADRRDEVAGLQRLGSRLEAAGPPLVSAGEVLDTTSRFLEDIPVHWPVGRGSGTVTMEWGANVNPFTNRWYFHRGIDIADFRANTPVVAAANGTVIETDFQQYGYGYYVDVQHRFGMVTRYAHLSRIDVSVGDEVSQGEQLGILGTTGRSTGPHVHFEVHIGPENVDPAAFLTVANTFRRRSTRR